MEHKDYYKILGISRDADSTSLKRAYRSLARQYHPDLNAGNVEAERMFKEVNEAYSVLSDVSKRQAYDQYGDGWQQRANTANNFNWSGWFEEETSSEPRHRPRTTTEEFEQSLHRERGQENEQSQADGQNSFSDLFQQFFKPQHDASPGSRTYKSRVSPFGRGEQTLPVEIGLEEAFLGTTRTIQQGTERFEISIPKGIATGSKVRVAHSPDLGHLTLLVTVKPHPLLTRDGDNLHTQIKVDLYTALLGGEIQVPTLEGNLLLVVPSNTQNGRIFRLKGQGMPLLKAPQRRGDLYVEIQVELPIPLSDEERRRFLELRRLRQSTKDLL